MKSSFLLAVAQDAFMLPCLNKQVLGVECPGCGIQRAFWMLMDGDFIGAFFMYPAIYPLIVLFGFIIADRFTNWRQSGRVIAFLAILTIGTILTNFILKFF